MSSNASTASACRASICSSSTGGSTGIPGTSTPCSSSTGCAATVASGTSGVTNFDGDHLRLLVKHGIAVATNQVSFSLLDRRPAGRMTEVCRETGVKLLAYGVLAGGFLSDRWVGRPEPTDIPDWSKSKYKRFIDAVGGWDAVQQVLAAAKTIAVKHGVSVANVAARWVLEQDAVGAVIIGARLGEREHRGDNLALFGSRSTPRTRRVSPRRSPGCARFPAIAVTNTESRRSSPRPAI